MHIRRLFNIFVSKLQKMVTLLITAILIFAFVLIATERLTNINKAAVAIFAGTVCWMVYVAYGTDFVMAMHRQEYSSFLNGAVAGSDVVKEYIARNIFLKYVGRASEIVLFLLATTSIVEILENNGCFDFIRQLLRTRKSRKMLWTIAIVTFVISANLDNLITTVMMLTIMHGIIPNRRQRMLYGAVIVISANYGGALTVIGDSTGLLLWNSGLVSATDFSMSLLLPCLIAWVVPTWWIGRSLPERIEVDFATMPYRGDDTRLNIWQRLLMLFVGIGGLWFIPSFHSITKLSPFIGALCVLSVLWIVNEVVNRKLLAVDANIQRRMPMVFQYGIIQMMLFVMGVMLAVGAVNETGAVDWLWVQLEAQIHNTWVYGMMAGGISSILDSFATSLSFITLNPSMELNADYWKIIAYCSAMGGNVLCIGSVSGLALLKAEHLHVGWYFIHVGQKCLVAGLLGLLAMYFIL